ncbi:unnamed protein product, partial [Ectocarpus sp. 8 AP-2014]
IRICVCVILSWFTYNSCCTRAVCRQQYSRAMNCRYYCSPRLLMEMRTCVRLRLCLQSLYSRSARSFARFTCATAVLYRPSGRLGVACGAPAESDQTNDVWRERAISMEREHLEQMAFLETDRRQNYTT